MRIYRLSEYTFYHGTDSEPFNEFDPSKAKKGEAYYNPLGDAMYVTDKKDFAKMFGENVYSVNIPDNAKIKRMYPSKVKSAIGDILNRALKKIGVNYWETETLFKVGYNRLLDMAGYSPYDAIIEAVEFVSVEFPDKAQEYKEWVSKIATQKFSSFDVVMFYGTNNPNDILIGETPTKEILIFNKAFQKVFAGSSPKMIQTASLTGE